MLLLPAYTLVFGGCCSNAITLEQITLSYPQSGSLLTFIQFLFISIHGLITNITFDHNWFPSLRPRVIPITSYIQQVTLFYFISLLNNAAIGYQIPIPVHIIFRSGGLIVSMLLNWLLVGRRFVSFSRTSSI